MSKEGQCELFNDIKDLLGIFKKNKREMWSAIRELSFSIILKDYSEFSKYTALLNNRAYGCKEQEKIKNKIAMVSGYMYNNKLKISSEELDAFFIKI